MHSARETKLPFESQVFGQRFLLDSFVLSKVVYDSILYEGRKEERLVPSGLDVMAALGNDEAVRLLEPELDEWHYGANLLAARTVVEQFDAWDENVYHQWLGALRTLDDEPNSPHFPKVMKNTAWQRKQLETQLGSWAELRHDTILYGKQSYAAYPSCEYPAGYVEPYPDFYERIARLATSLSLGLKQRMKIDSELAGNRLLVRQGEFFATFADTVKRLKALAEKQLRAEAFTGDEERFLKQTIDARGGGSGPPTYDGWYPKLIFGAEPADWNPEVADVHTNPKDGNVLQVAVGDVGFVVVAIDNESDRAAYVGPIYSYYEFAHPVGDRLTDEAWQGKIRRGEIPEPPTWTELFRHPPLKRSLGGVW
jgi:hypothetical protein